MKDSLMKNPSFETDRDKWELERGAADGIRSPLRPMQASSSDIILQDLRLRIHRKLIDTLDLSKLSNLEMERVKVEIRRILEDLVMSEAIPLSRADRDRLVMEVQHEVFGLGPLEILMKDPEVSDILVNTPHHVYVERYGKLEKTDVRFRDDAHLMQIIERIVTRVGRRVDESSPMVDARLADGSRVNAIIPPLALDGPILSIRRFGAERLTINDLIQFNSLPPQIGEVAAACVKSRLNILVSGGTGAGKTTLLNCLSNYIPENERIVTIEDSAELKLQQEHVVRLETRPPNIEGQGSVTQRDLVRNALRMRPDRIVVGEVRGGEALDMMQAMNTGHDGSISTIHANSARDALSRLETMMLMAGISLPERALREQVASALDVIVQLSRLSDGSRKLIEFTEVTGMEGPTITTQTIFKFEQRGVENGKIVGEFVATGVMPSFLDRLERYGFRIPNTHFMSASLSTKRRGL
jgi:pilus assembly protein CpaF